MSYYNYIIEVSKHGKHVYGKDFIIKSLSDGKVSINCGKKQNTLHDNSMNLSNSLFKHLFFILNGDLKACAEETINYMYWYSHKKIMIGDTLFKEMPV